MLFQFADESGATPDKPHEATRENKIFPTPQQNEYAIVHEIGDILETLMLAMINENLSSKERSEKAVEQMEKFLLSAEKMLEGRPQLRGPVDDIIATLNEIVDLLSGRNKNGKVKLTVALQDKVYEKAKRITAHLMVINGIIDAE